MPEPRVAGVDGCRAGWLAVIAPPGDYGAAQARVIAALGVLVADPCIAVLAVDVPIGLMDAHEPGGRAADRAARRFLQAGAPAGMVAAGSRVFPAPTRAQLARFRAAADYAGVNAGAAPGARLSRQCFNILPKIAEADALADTPAGARLCEVHPELSFSLATGATLAPKRSAEGRARRTALLQALGFDLPALAGALGPPQGRWQPDDLWDACIACWSGARILARAHRSFPEHPPADGRGRPVAILA